MKELLAGTPVEEEDLPTWEEAILNRVELFQQFGEYAVGRVRLSLTFLTLQCLRFAESVMTGRAKAKLTSWWLSHIRSR